MSSILSHLGHRCRMARKIEYDPNTRTIPGNAQANALLKREYAPGMSCRSKDDQLSCHSYVHDS